MTKDIFTRQDELEHKQTLRKIYFRALNAAVPKYITHANQEISYYFDVRRDIDAIFDQHFGQVDASTFFAMIEALCEKNQANYSFSQQGMEYLHFFNKKLLITTHNYLYDNQFLHLINYYDDKNRELDSLIKNPVKNTIHQLRDKHDDNDKLVRQTQFGLQHLRERYGVEVMVADNISWKQVQQWVENMTLILAHTAQEMGVSEYSRVNENITIICCEDYKAESGFFSPHGVNKKYIQVCLDTMDNMNRTWLHEYTHYLDYQAGQFFIKKNTPYHGNMYLSEYLLFYKTTNTIKQTEASEMLQSTQELLRLSLGIKGKDFNQQIELANERVQRLQDYFFISMFETIGIQYQSLPDMIAVLHYTNYDFLPELVSAIAKLPYRNHQHFIEQFNQPTNTAFSQLKDNILMFRERLGLSQTQAQDMVKKISEPEFIKKYITHAKQFFSHEGIIHFMRYGQFSYIQCDSDFVKRSLLTEKPHYWTNVIEMVARSVEVVNEAPEIEQKRKFFDYFKVLGAKSVTENTQTVVDTLYPNKALYTMQLKSTIKLAFKHMFEYVNAELAQNYHPNVVLQPSGKVKM